MLFSQQTRNASTILTKQKNRIKKNNNYLIKMNKYTRLAKLKLENGELLEFAKLIDKNWEFKKII